VGCPTLIVHCVGDPVVPISDARWLSDQLPHAELIEIDDDFHVSYDPADMELYLAELDRFLGSDHLGRSQQSAGRVLATVLFTDVVGSTRLAVELGDQAWRELMDRHDDVTRRVVERFNGTVVKFTGDGVLALLDAPSRTLDAAIALRDELARCGLEIRAGIHTGEIEQRADDVAGIGVNTAARVLNAAGDGCIWATSTVVGLTAGSHHSFTPKGPHRLKGIPGNPQLHELDRA